MTRLFRSTLDATRRTAGPVLDDDERVLLQSQGACRQNPRSGWKLGQLYLTDRRVLFFQPIGVVFQSPVDRIRHLTIEKGNYAFGVKDMLRLSYQRERDGRLCRAWVVTGDLARWKTLLEEKALIQVDEGAVAKVAEQLDTGGRAILWYLWEKRHARINALAEAVEAPSHMDVLLKIRGEINPTAERLLGYSFLAFERSKVDPQTQEVVTFSWWVIGQRQPLRPNEPLLDLFDEGDHLTIVAELPGLREEEVEVEIRDKTLTIVSRVPGRECHEEIRLPAEVQRENVTKRCRNTILEITLEKLKRLEEPRGEFSEHKCES